MNISYLIISFTLTTILIPIYCNYAKRNSLLDYPTSRSSHIAPKPSGGGIILLLIFIIFSLVNSNYHSLIFLPLGIIGFIDDKINISSKIRYLVQFLTMIVITLITKPFLLEFNFILLLLYLLIICFIGTAVINFINFMDGLDGLVSSSFLIIFITIASTRPIDNISVLVGSIIGFLIWNIEPSKIFMGDVGSTFLGSIFIYSILQADGFIDNIVALLLAAPLLTDAFICVIRRLIAGENIFTAHKLHLYQRLNQANWSHSKVAFLYLIMTLFVCLSYFSNQYKLMIIILELELLIAIFLDQKVAISFKKALQKERSSRLNTS